MTMGACDFLERGLRYVTTFNYHHLEYGMDNHLSFIRKAVFSSSPNDSKDYVLVVIYEGGHLAFGESEMSTGPMSNPENILSVISFFILRNYFMGSYVGARLLPNPTVAWFIRHGPCEYIIHWGDPSTVYLRMRLVLLTRCANSNYSRLI